jgi:hypothetical protein
MVFGGGTVLPLVLFFPQLELEQYADEFLVSGSHIQFIAMLDAGFGAWGTARAAVWMKRAYLPGAHVGLHQAKVAPVGMKRAHLHGACVDLLCARVAMYKMHSEV